jgi:hypothetical protein
MADFTAAVNHERAISASLGGKTVFDDTRTAPKKRGDAQLSLFE